MITWLHSFNPQAILFSFGFINIYWYGLFMVTGIIAALLIIFRLAPYYKIEKDFLFDLSFWLIINGLLGARIYDILLQIPYYMEHPLNMLKIWQGGLAIHGAIIGGLITIYSFSKKRKVNFWSLSSLLVPGLALGQAIGRWGNYFNQELFGLPTAKPWGIPINEFNRPLDYFFSTFFHPTFLYESLGCLFIFFALIAANYFLIKKNRLTKNNCILLTSGYLIAYSILRFFLEFIRIDETPVFLNLRWPQIASLLIIIIAIIFITLNIHAKKENK